MPTPRSLQGIAFAIGACASFALLDTTVQSFHGAVPVLMMLWVQYTFQTIVTTASLLPSQGWRLLRTARPKLQILRGSLLVCSTGLAFASLQVMPVSEFTAIVMVIPLLITFVAATWFKQSISALSWALIVGGFVGALIIIRPNLGLQPALVLPLGCVTLNAAFQLLTSRIMPHENPQTTLMISSLVGMVCSSVALAFVFTPMPSTQLWARLLLMCLASTAGHWMLIKTYQKAAATTITPYLYTQIVFAILGGWLAFHYIPDQWSLVGICLIAMCGVLSAWLSVRQITPPLVDTSALRP
jgi:drug/metabolite transporter (DMT)-like permease